MKTHDTLGRKLRHVKQKDGTEVSLTLTDIEMFAFLHRHGGRLPTSYLHSARGLTNLQSSSVRLKHLARAGYLKRPDAQYETKDSEYNELVHELSPKAIALLKSEDAYFEYAPSMKGAFKHQVMLSCISASFELNAKKHGYQFYPQHVILNGIKRDHHIQIDKEHFTPDELFMLVIDGKPLLIFLEVDRGTEPTETKRTTRKSWGRSIAQYRKLIANGIYKQRFNAQAGALLLIVTISQAKEDGILRAIESEFKGPCNFMLVRNMPEFGRIFHPPLVLDMLGQPWARAGYAPFKFA